MDEILEFFGEFIEECDTLNEAAKSYGEIYNTIMKAMKDRNYIAIYYEGEKEEGDHKRIVAPFSVGRGFISHASGTPKEVNTTTRYLRGYIIFDTHEDEDAAKSFKAKTKIGGLFKRPKKSYSVSDKRKTGWRLFRIDRIVKVKVFKNKQFNTQREDYNEDDKTFVDIMYSVPKALLKENFQYFKDYFKAILD